MIEMYRQVLATMKIEGLTPSEEAQKLSKKYLKGTIEGKTVIAKILRMYGIEAKS